MSGVSEIGSAIGILRSIVLFLRDQFGIRRSLVRFYGKSILRDDGKAMIIIDSFSLDRDRIRKAAQSAGDAELGSFPYFKRFPDGPVWSFTGGFSLALGEGSFRGMLHLLALFAPHRGTALSVLIDERAWDRWEGTLICVGGPTANWHTYKILNQAENTWYNLGKRSSGEFGLFRKADEEIIYEETDRHYGLVLRIPNAEHKGHWLFVCAGLGERGTSAACYYLAKHWEELRKEFRGKPFGIIVEAESHSDESSRRVTFDDVVKRQREARPERNEVEQPRERTETGLPQAAPSSTITTVTHTASPAPSGVWVTRPPQDCCEPKHKHTGSEDR